MGHSGLACSSHFDPGSRLTRSLRNPRAPDMLGACFRRQALAPKSATLRALGLDRESTAKQGDYHAMNADPGLLGSKKAKL